MDSATRSQLIATYREGPVVVRKAVETLTDAELDHRPADGSWTARMVVHHLADSEMTSGIRLRKLLAEENPTIYGYDEELFARVLFYDRPIALSLDAIRVARESAAELLDRLNEAQWQRTGTHSESGAYGVETWLEIYAAHCHDHARQIRVALGN